MRLSGIALICLLLTLLSVSAGYCEGKACAHTYLPTQATVFQARATENGINIRTDSTTSSQIISVLKKGDYVDVVGEFYDWYRIRLPITAPAFIRKDMVEIIDQRSARVTKNNVNIRLHATTKAAVIGKAAKYETVFIAEDRGEWYKIYPTLNTYGWVNKNLMVKANKPKEPPFSIPVSAGTGIAKQKPEADKVVVEGLLKKKVFTRQATHKLITADKKVYLISAPKINLRPYNDRRVRVTGRTSKSSPQAPDLTLEADKIEALD